MFAHLQDEVRITTSLDSGKVETVYKIEKSPSILPILNKCQFSLLMNCEKRCRYWMTKEMERLEENHQVKKNHTYPHMCTHMYTHVQTGAHMYTVHTRDTYVRTQYMCTQGHTGRGQQRSSSKQAGEMWK